MKLLFDQNLSPFLVKKLRDLFPGSKHVQEVGLSKASDTRIWTYALENDFTIISKDTDFSDRIELSGYPPKVIWIRKENCSTKVIELMLRHNVADIRNFDQDSDRGELVLF